MKIEWSLKSTPSYINLNSIEGVLQYQLYKDSIFDFFPYYEWAISDLTGMFSELLIFIEGLTFDTSLKDHNKNQIKNSYFWSESSMTKPIAKDIISGVTNNYLLSACKIKDAAKSYSYYKNISDIVKLLIAPYKFTNSYISTTNNFDYWYQSNEEDFKFIKKLSDYAYSLIFRTPYISFINSNNEFYFKNISELLNETEVGTIKYGKTLTPILGSLEEDIISMYGILNKGAPHNLRNYKHQYYSVSPSGTYSNKNVSVKELVQSSKKNTILTDKLSSNRTVSHYGIVDNDFNLKGWAINLLKKSLFPYQLVVELNTLNLKYVCGKTISTEFISPHSKSGKSKEYSDKWLILESTHMVTDQTSKTQVLLGRNSLPLNPINRLYSNV